MPRSKKTTPEENSKKKPQLNKSTKKKTSPIKKSSPTENVELKFYEVFPIKLEHLDKSINEKKVCYFQCKEHLESYLKRYKLKKRQYTVSKTEER